jgi:hypothetical protein
MFPVIKGNVRTDAIWMSLLKSEWKDTIKSELKLKPTNKD